MGFLYKTLKSVLSKRKRSRVHLPPSNLNKMFGSIQKAAPIVPYGTKAVSTLCLDPISSEQLIMSKKSICKQVFWIKHTLKNEQDSL